VRFPSFDSSSPVITLIGGGFSGTMTAVNLILKAKRTLTINLIEKSAALAKGVAYGTEDPFHILNVHAKNMGAYAEEKEHFYLWLQQNEPLWRSLDPDFRELELSPEAFMPRMIYGKYLELVWKEALELAKKKKITVNVIQEEKLSASPHP